LVSADEADLVITRAADSPSADSAAWWLGIGPIDPSEAARKAAKNLLGPYILERDHPLLEGVTLDGVIWAGVQPVKSSNTPLISVGRTPLLAQLAGVSRPAYLLNIDLAGSNLGESPDWPILISNLLELRRADLPGLNRWNYRLGEGVRFRLSPTQAEGEEADSAELTLVHGGVARPLPRGRIVDVVPPAHSGLYEIRDGNQIVGQFAVNFEDAEESNLSGLFPGLRAPTAPQPTAVYEIDPQYSWILLGATFLVLVLLLVNWWWLAASSSKLV